MAICGRITKNQGFDPCAPSVEGIEQYMYVFNRDEIASYERDAENPNIITAITMKVGKKGFRFGGYNTSVGGRFELVKKTYSNTYDHIVNGIIFNRGSEAKNELEGVANGEFVVILENKHKLGDAAFESFGTDVGLISRTITGNAADGETAGAYPFELGSPEATKEPHTPATIFDTDIATTRAMLEAIVTPVV